MVAKKHIGSDRDEFLRSPRVTARPGSGAPEEAGLVSAVLALQRAAGNVAVGQLLQPAASRRAASMLVVQLQGPGHADAGMGTDEVRAAYEAATPTPLTTIDDLIRLVTRVEAAYPSDNWQGITTRIRKSYYDDALWNQLIVRRAGYGTVNSPPLSMPDFKALGTVKDHPEIRLPSGDVVDMGHVLTGMDASNFPETNWKFSLAGIEGPPGATWSGDVGSALAEWDIHAGSHRDRRQEYYERFASRDDMLGDVDGIALAAQPAAPGAGGDRLSSRLRAYYLPASGGTAGVSRRFTKFAQASGFAWTGRGTAIALDAAARQRIRAQVDTFGVQYRRKQVGIERGAGQNWFHNEDIDWFVNRFIRWVEVGLAAENP